MQSNPPASLPEPAETLQFVLDSVRNYAVIILDHARRVILWNQGAQHLLGWSDEEIIGQSSDVFFTPEERETGIPEQVYHNVIQEGQADSERWYVRKDGTRFYGGSFLFPFARSPMCIKIIHDLTEQSQLASLAQQRQTEADALNVRLQRALDEAQVAHDALLVAHVQQQELTETTQRLNARLQRAMQESHHRIKNNLQVVAALVEMQIGEVGASLCDEHLKRINRHVRALANLHDLLTQQVTENLETDRLDTQDVLERLIPLLQEASGGRRITVESVHILLSAQKAASLSLLVSECVSNAVKHAEGEINVTLRVVGERAHLEVGDAGKGFPSDFDPRTAAHMGLSLIDSTARHDLGGEVRYFNKAAGGGCISVTFPLPSSAFEADET